MYYIFNSGQLWFWSLSCRALKTQESLWVSDLPFSYTVHKDCHWKCLRLFQSGVKILNIDRFTEAGIAGSFCCLEWDCVGDRIQIGTMSVTAFDAKVFVYL